METIHYILFCEDPFESGKVDPDFGVEFDSAQNNGFKTLLFGFDDIDNGAAAATQKIKPSAHPVQAIYRGWMLTPKQYASLHDALLEKNYRLINSQVEYQNCHYLPDSLKFIGSRTPETVFQEGVDPENLSILMEKVKVFGNKPVIIKDFVKSEKHDWETACFVPDASNTENLAQTMQNFLQLRGKYLNEGIVVREFIALNDLAIHSKSGMPLTEEYRLFFCNGQLLGMYDYWEEGDYTRALPDTSPFEKIAHGVESHFFSMDIARQKDGELVIIELGDGQVAGLPERLDINAFYARLRTLCTTEKTKEDGI